MEEAYGEDEEHSGYEKRNSINAKTAPRAAARSEIYVAIDTNEGRQFLIHAALLYSRRIGGIGYNNSYA